MKKIQESLLIFIDDEDNVEKNFQNLTDIFNNLKIRDNQHELNSLLHLIVEISNNHHHSPNFYNKIDQILGLFKEEIKKYYPKTEIYNIFKSNNRNLLYLINEKILNIEDLHYRKIINGYFNPEILNFEDFHNKKFSRIYSSEIDEIKEDLKDLNSSEIDEIKEERKSGENSHQICKLIRNDSVNEYVEYITKNNINVNSSIDSSYTETNSFLLNKRNVKLIEYAVLFSSSNIIEYLLNNGVKLTSNIWNYAIHSGSKKMIILLDDYNVKPENNSYNSFFNDLIRCHHNDMIQFIQRYYSKDKIYNNLDSIHSKILITLDLMNYI